MASNTQKRNEGVASINLTTVYGNYLAALIVYNRNKQEKEGASKCKCQNKGDDFMIFEMLEQTKIHCTDNDHPEHAFVKK